VGYFDEHKTGDILSRMSSDTEVIQNGMGTNISMFVRSLVFIIGTTIVLFFISWELTLITLGGILPIMGLGMCIGRKLKELSKKQQDAKAALG